MVDCQVQAHDRLPHKTLPETRLRDEGIVGLGIQRKNGAFCGAPNEHRLILPNDTLLPYERISTLQNLDNRNRIETEILDIKSRGQAQRSDSRRRSGRQ